MNTLPSGTVQMPQSYGGTAAPEAVEIAEHDLRIELDRVLAHFEDIHPRNIREMLDNYVADYLKEHLSWDRWTPLEFEELAEGLETVRSTPKAEGSTATLLDALEAASPVTQESFVRICNQNLIAGQDLTLGNRIDAALNVLTLEQEDEDNELDIEIQAQLETLDGQATVCILTADEGNRIYIDPRGVDLTADQAQLLAEALLSAAQTLEMGLGA